MNSTQRGDTQLREVEPGDIEIFYEHQLDQDATVMAAFPSRDRDSHFAHWKKILQDESCITRTILAEGEVAGNIGSWIQDGHREVGYWIGKAHWGRGVATSALKQFVETIGERPIYAWVAHHNRGSMRVLEKCGFIFDHDESDLAVFKISER